MIYEIKICIIATIVMFVVYYGTIFLCGVILGGAPIMYVITSVWSRLVTIAFLVVLIALILINVKLMDD